MTQGAHEMYRKLEVAEEALQEIMQLPIRGLGVSRAIGVARAAIDEMGSVKAHRARAMLSLRKSFTDLRNPLKGSYGVDAAYWCLQGKIAMAALNFLISDEEMGRLVVRATYLYTCRR
jgi:hypothetical protein